MKISIDLDGVVSKFEYAAGKVANSIWPGRIPHNFEPQDWSWSGYLNKDEFKELFRVIKSIPNFWESQMPYYDNLCALRGFLQDESGHDVYYVTSRAETVGNTLAKQCENWLMGHHIWPEENYHAVLPIREGSPATAKKAVMEALGIELSVDDYGPTVELCNTIPGHRAYLLDRPWNRDKAYGIRLWKLQEFLDIVTKGRMN